MTVHIRIENAEEYTRLFRIQSSLPVMPSREGRHVTLEGPYRDVHAILAMIKSHMA